jgi:hypothetical protein
MLLGSNVHLIQAGVFTCSASAFLTYIKQSLCQLKKNIYNHILEFFIRFPDAADVKKTDSEGYGLGPAQRYWPH